MQSPPPQQGVLAWAIALFGLTALGIAPLYAFVPDLSKFSGKLPPAQLAAVGLGVELTAFAPSLAAILVAWLLPGAGGARALFRQLKRWRIHPIWYLIALLGPVPLLLLGTLIWAALGKATAVWLALPGSIPFTIGALIAGSLGEEFGWRGFAQPRLQQRAVIYAWIYNSTGGSLLGGHGCPRGLQPGDESHPGSIKRSDPPKAAHRRRSLCGGRDCRRTCHQPPNPHAPLTWAGAYRPTSRRWKLQSPIVIPMPMTATRIQNPVQ